MARRSREADFDPVDVGNEEFGDEPIAIVKGRTAASFIPASIARLDEDQAEVVGQIQHVALAIADHQDMLDNLVGEARDLGVSWSAIGWSVGTTSQAARKRWKPDEDL